MRTRRKGPAALAHVAEVLFSVCCIFIGISGRRLADLRREDLGPFQVVPSFHHTILEVGRVAQSRLGDGLRRETQVPALRAVVALRALFGERRRGDGVPVAPRRHRRDAKDTETDLHLQAVLGDPQVVGHAQAVLVEGPIISIVGHEHVIDLIHRADVHEIRLEVLRLAVVRGEGQAPLSHKGPERP